MGRHRSDHEIDLVVESDDGRVVAVKMKSSRSSSTAVEVGIC
jgi:hypothetical protein